METILEWLEGQIDSAKSTGIDWRRVEALEDALDKLKELYGWKDGPPQEGTSNGTIFQFEWSNGVESCNIFAIGLGGEFYELPDKGRISRWCIQRHRRIMEAPE